MNHSPIFRSLRQFADKLANKFANKRIRLIAGILLVALIGGGIFIVKKSATPNASEKSTQTSGGRSTKAGEGGPGGEANRPQPVRVAEVQLQDFPVWLSALGTVTPRRSVIVKSRVDGELLRLHFQEGDFVRQGQLLAELDPRTYLVQRAQAQGQLLKDTALLNNARIDLKRYQDLLAQDSIARQQVDTQAALVRQYQGTVAADRAAVDSAQLQLSYTRIVSPLDGRVGLRQVDPGNMVHASDSNGLVTITQFKPITVLFPVPEDKLAQVNRKLGQQQRLTVEVWDREQSQRLAVGTLLTLDNSIDTASGSVKARAQFANDDMALFPNQFVNARLLLETLPNTLVIPTAAVLRSARGMLVYAVQDDASVRAIPVNLGATYADQVAVTSDALKPGMKLVIEGLDKLRDGAKVRLPTAENASDSANKPNSARSERRQQRTPTPAN